MWYNNIKEIGVCMENNLSPGLLFALIACIGIPLILVLGVNNVIKKKINIKDKDLDLSRNKKGFEYRAQKASSYAKIWNPSQVFGHKSMEKKRDMPINDVGVKTQKRPTAHNSTPECFFVLGFEKKPTEDELKSRYRALVKKYHPDKSDGDVEFFEEINKAYNTAKKYY